MLRCIALCLLFAGAAAVPGLVALAADAPSADEIAQWVEKLNSERFADRQAASEKLAAIGKPAIPALAKAAAGDSLEATIRSVEILKKLYGSSDESAKTAAKEALEQIAKSDNAAAARRAKEIVAPKPEEQPPQFAPGSRSAIV